ncbi:3-phosphoglycerate dehydrogenase, partial [Candidatus Kaiserbacteria bacterium]|nr:3-phosphoglycerate dehydrogenase [Candidatus Kaiserbacteria bacterium]
MGKKPDIKGRIRLFDKIHPVVREQFGNAYEIGGEEIIRPDEIVVRDTEIDVMNFPGLLAVGRAGIGVNRINVGVATRYGIAVFNTPGGNAKAVSELFFTMLGMCARNIDRALHVVRTTAAQNEEDLKKKLKAEKECLGGFELNGKTLGVIGLGHIGREVADDGLRRGMNVIGYDPYASRSGMHQLDRSVRVVKRMEEVL